MMKYLRFAAKGIAVLLAALIPAAAFVWHADPYGFLHTPDGIPVYFENARMQLPGMIKNLDFDICVVGTSMAENFVMSEVSEAMGGTAIKLTVNASYVTEQAAALEMALREKNVRDVIWVIDYRCVDIKYGDVFDEQVSFPFYLYDSNPLNDWRYILNHDVFYLSFRVERFRREQKYNPFGEIFTDPDRLFTWYRWQKFGEKQVTDDYNALLSGKKTLKLNAYPIETVRDTVDRTVMRIIKAYPDVNFHLIYPPKSILWHKLLYEKGLTAGKWAAQEYIASEVLKLGNVTLYNLQNEFGLVRELSKYLDVNHYNKEGNDLMLSAIAAKNHIVTSVGELRAANEELLRKAIDFLAE